MGFAGKLESFFGFYDADRIINSDVMQITLDLDLPDTTPQKKTFPLIMYFDGKFLSSL
jgi:hypothetical protein